MLVLGGIAVVNAAPVGGQKSGTFSGSTSSTGLVTVTHDLGMAPSQVFVSFVAPSLAQYQVTQKNVTSFQIKVMRPYNNAAYNGPVTFDWQILTNTVAPTTTPPPTTAPPTTACMPDPSVCSFPDVENTGTLAGVARQAVSGTVTLSTTGQVYENKTVTGEIVVTAPNVVIRNVQVLNNAPWYVVSVKNGGSWETTNANLLLDHVDLNLGGNLEIKGIAFNGYTVRNSFIHNGADCAHFGVNVTVEDSLCVNGPDVNNDGWPDAGFSCQDGPHYDGFQSDGGRNITLRHNTIRNPCGQTSAILMSSNTSAISDVTIADNLMAGGGYTLYCNAGPDVLNETVTGNRFSRQWYPKSGYWGPTTGCENADVFTNNRWDEDNTLL